MSAATDAHIEAQKRLRDRLTHVVGGMWLALPAYDEPQVPEFVAAASAVVLAAQRQSVALTNAYLARLLGRQPLPLDAAEIIAASRPGVDAATQWRRPFVTVWTALGNRIPYEQAVTNGLHRATDMAATDVQLAARGTFHAVGEADGTIRGYQRVADPGACTYCSAIDGAFVKNAAAMPLHPGCGCSLTPVMGRKPPHTATPAGVAVHEHGELGPVVGAAAHDFTSPNDL